MKFLITLLHSRRGYLQHSFRHSKTAFTAHRIKFQILISNLCKLLSLHPDAESGFFRIQRIGKGIKFHLILTFYLTLLI
jgi:hypothetical protein